MVQETVWVTGASSGIGKELVRLFAADGIRPILLARRSGVLEALPDDLPKAPGADPRAS
jgi:hypothetical protein